MKPSRLRWLRALALLPLGCARASTPVATAAPETPTSSATVAEPTPSGCWCYRHKSDGEVSQGRPACAIGQLDYAGTPCAAPDPAEGPLPPPDLPVT